MMAGAKGARTVRRVLQINGQINPVSAIML
jgi:hypothetical protein